MKKKLICFAMAMMLILSSSVTAFASSANANIAPNLNTNQSLQLMYAKLQLGMAEASKQQAMDKMDQIAEGQEEQRRVLNFLNDARRYQSEAKSTDAETGMPFDMAEYMDANRLSYDTTGDDLLMTAEEWDVAIKSLEHHLEELSMETQQQMVYLQDFMGQYNSYLQGANTQISNANQTLTNLARGQSMYGNSEVGLAVTGLVLGLVLGCAATLAVQKVRRKKDAV